MDVLTYKGDHRKFQANRIVGPDMFGAWYIPVTAHYFNGYTRIFYKPVPPEKLPPQCIAMSKQVVAQQQRGKVQQWPRGNEPSPQTKLLSSSLQYHISRRNGNPRTSSGAKGLTKSQKELLKRFKRPGSK
jgi:hypothetical protein